MTDLAVRDAGIPAQVNRARAALQTVESVEDAIRVADYAEAVRYAARQAKAGMEAENAAAEVRLRAERRAGELLREMEKNEGGRPRETGSTMRPVPEKPPTLSDIGVTKHQSSRYQQVAAVPEPVFEEHISDAKTNGHELTTASLLRKSKNTLADAAERMLEEDAPETKLRLDDDRVILLVYTAIAKIAPAKTAEQRILQAIARADRDTLDYLAGCAGSGDVINRITKAAADLLADNRLRRVK